MSCLNTTRSDIEKQNYLYYEALVTDFTDSPPDFCQHFNKNINFRITAI